jgi:hypothetical protein
MSPADTPDSELPIVDDGAAPCRHLRNKGMYVYTDGLGGDAHDDYDNTIYWCLKTMKGFGPDDDFVGGEECRNSARACYEPM